MLKFDIICDTIYSMEKEVFKNDVIYQLSVTRTCDCLAIKSYILKNKIEVYVLRTATTPKNMWTVWVNRNEYYNSSKKVFDIQLKYIEAYYLEEEEIVTIVELLNENPELDIKLMLKIANLIRKKKA